MKPTVSVIKSGSSLPKLSSLVVGSSVANSLSSASTSEPVSLFNKLDFPAFVYPTIAATGICVSFLLFLVTSLVRFTCSSSDFN